MAILKCKMCGADLNLSSEDKIVTCDYCGSTQTIPIIDDEKILKLYARGNNLRSQYDFDKAYSLFEQIISEGKEEAEVYWNLLLCKYGITYVDDYNGGKKPTINRMSFDLIMDDPDYENVLEYADALSREVYKAQLKEIHQIQKRIIDISKKEEPYDVFISYKETDVNGDRTEDSVIAQEIYNELTKEGYRVFLSRITLADAVGQEYEPIIYSALYSAPIMILVGTDVDYINATWVKNEWSRYLNMMKTTAKKNIIPCYKYLDAYDLPKEIRNIQSINFNKLGAIQDLIIGVNKISGKSKKKKEVNVNPFANLYNTLTTYIEKESYPQAKALIEQLLIFEPNNHELYFYKFLVENKCNDVEYILSNYEQYVNTESYGELKKYFSTSKMTSDFIDKLETRLYKLGREKMENKEYGAAANMFSIITEHTEFDNLPYFMQICRVNKILEKLKSEYDYEKKDIFGVEEELDKLLSFENSSEVVEELRKEKTTIILEKTYTELCELIDTELEEYTKGNVVNNSGKVNILNKVKILSELNYKDSSDKATNYTNLLEDFSKKITIKMYVANLENLLFHQNSRYIDKTKFDNLINKLQPYSYMPEVKKAIIKYTNSYTQICNKKNMKRLQEIFNALEKDPRTYKYVKSEAELILNKVKPNIPSNLYDTYISVLNHYEKNNGTKEKVKKILIGMGVAVVVSIIFIIILIIFITILQL